MYRIDFELLPATTPPFVPDLRHATDTRSPTRSARSPARTRLHARARTCSGTQYTRACATYEGRVRLRTPLRCTRRRAGSAHRRSLARCRYFPRITDDASDQVWDESQSDPFENFDDTLQARLRPPLAASCRGSGY